MDGFGTDEDTLNRALGGVDKSVAFAVAQRYQERYDKSLSEQLKGEVGGDYLQVPNFSLSLCSVQPHALLLSEGVVDLAGG